jgi:hypothetical protein
VGSQHLRERFCTQTISRAKFNKDVKIRKADFFLYLRPAGRNLVCAKHNIICRRQHHLHEVQHRAPFGRGVTERNTFALAKVLTPSKIPKQSFVILKRGGASLSSRIEMRLCLILRNLLKRLTKTYRWRYF